MLSVRFLASFIAFSSLLTTPGFARQPDHGCYIQTSRGEIVNLSKTVCRFDLGDEFAKQDAAYIAAIKKRMGRYGQPSIMAMLNNNPGVFTSAAREYCQAMQSGMSENQYIERKYQTLMDSQAVTPDNREQYQRDYQAKILPVSMAMSLAGQHYCPQIADRRSRR